jgi:hypothetical protein
MKIYYTYLWLRENGQPYYVGKGSGRRAFIQHKHIVKKPPRDRILIQEFHNEQAAFIAEEILIAYYGRECDGGCLLNLSPGGTASVGRKGQTLSDEHKNKIRLALTGNKNGVGNKARLGQPNSPEARRKIGLANLGHKVSESNKQKLRLANLGNKHCLGRVYTDEIRNKISVANKAAWARRKGQTQCPKEIF